MSERIRLDQDTYAALAALKGENETFDELVTRLLAQRRVALGKGAGPWENGRSDGGSSGP